MRRSDFLYTSCYCEENVWHLAADPRIEGDRRFVVFISNRARCVALWRQRAAPNAETPVLWDYHVVLLIDRTDHGLVWDLDTTLEFPCSAESYLEQTFPFDTELAPRFRVIDADVFRAHFASDRSHMKHSPAAPPSWPLIGTGMNLMRFVDTEADFLGETYDLEQLRERVTR